MCNKEEKKSLSRFNGNIFNLLMDLPLSVIAEV